MPDFQPDAFGTFYQGKPMSWQEEMAKPRCEAYWRHPDFYLHLGHDDHPDPEWREPIKEFEHVCLVAKEGCAAVHESLVGCYFRVIAFKQGGKEIDVKSHYAHEPKPRTDGGATARRMKFDQALAHAKKLLSSMQTS
tara:strand:- start:16 stop:426 length:411 start_codon:yes stop_codon:yes gene_type:complete